MIKTKEDRLKRLKELGFHADIEKALAPIRLRDESSCGSCGQRVDMVEVSPAGTRTRIKDLAKKKNKTGSNLSTQRTEGYASSKIRILDCVEGSTCIQKIESVNRERKKKAFETDSGGNSSSRIKHLTIAGPDSICSIETLSDSGRRRKTKLLGMPFNDAMNERVMELIERGPSRDAGIARKSGDKIRILEQEVSPNGEPEDVRLRQLILPSNNRIRRQKISLSRLSKADRSTIRMKAIARNFKKDLFMAGFGKRSKPGIVELSSSALTANEIALLVEAGNAVTHHFRNETHLAKEDDSTYLHIANQLLRKELEDIQVPSVRQNRTRQLEQGKHAALLVADKLIGFILQTLISDAQNVENAISRNTAIGMALKDLDPISADLSLLRAAFMSSASNGSGAGIGGWECSKDLPVKPTPSYTTCADGTKYVEYIYPGCIFVHKDGSPMYSPSSNVKPCIWTGSTWTANSSSGWSGVSYYCCDPSGLTPTSAECKQKCGSNKLPPDFIAVLSFFPPGVATANWELVLALLLAAAILAALNQASKKQIPIPTWPDDQQEEDYCNSMFVKCLGTWIQSIPGPLIGHSQCYACKDKCPIGE